MAKHTSSAYAESNQNLLTLDSIAVPPYSRIASEAETRALSKSLLKYTKHIHDEELKVFFSKNVKLKESLEIYLCAHNKYYNKIWYLSFNASGKKKGMHSIYNQRT